MSENILTYTNNSAKNDSNERATLLAVGANDSKPASGNNSNGRMLPLLLLNRAPLANSEAEDDDDDREVVTTPHPGVDDGFFADNDKPDRHPDVDAERIPTVPHDREPVEPSVPRTGPDGGNHPDETDGKFPYIPRSPQPSGRFPSFPMSPGFGGGGFDVEGGSIPDPDSLPDVNVYQHKKTLAQGMMDLALFSANANQLRYVLESYGRHPYFYPSVSLIAISLILQVAVGIGLIWNATYNVKDETEICLANRISNFTIIGIFLVTVVNVFISAFGVANPAPTT